MLPKTTDAKSQHYQLFMLALCLYALGALGAQSVLALDPATRSIFDYADYAVCGIFFLDFLLSFIKAPQKAKYFFTWGWIDLASSIPTVDVLRWGRAARVLRIFQVLRGIRATKLIASVILERRSEGAFLAAALISILLVVFASIAILHFETVPDSNIKSAEDALWWAFVTITTVGYGDKVPFTTEGRFIAALLMTAGVGLFGTFLGLLRRGSWRQIPSSVKASLNDCARK
jgi:voltage-gated potassium channel